MTELVVPVVFDDGVLTVDLEHLPATDDDTQPALGNSASTKSPTGD